MNNQNIRHVISRLALAVILIGFGVWEIVQPSYWNSFVPPFVKILSPNTFVMIHGVVLLILGLAVLLGIYLRMAAILSSLILLSIIGDLLLGYGFSDLVVRDIVVFLLAVSLIFDDTDYLRLKN